MKPININEFIEQVRKELLSPRHATTKDEALPLFFIDEVELEISVTVTSDLSGNGKINLQVVEVGTSANHQNENVHKITIKMTPLISKDKFIQDLEKNGRIFQEIEKVGYKSLLKEDGMAGEVP